MPQAILDQVISQLDTLQAEELQQLEDAVRIRLGLASEEEKKRPYNEPCSQRA